MPLRRRQHRCRTVTRVLAAGLAFAVASVFTPCCELFAASAAAGATHANVVSAPVADLHAPAPDSWCATALDQIVTPLADLAPVAPSSCVTVGYAPYSYVLPSLASLAVRRAGTYRAAAGPPLYLRFAHLLI